MSINLHISGEDAGIFEENLRGVMRLLARDELTKPAAPVSTVPPPAAESEPVTNEETGPQQAVESEPQGRLYGQAGGGKRRTKAEMAEDEEIDNLCDALGRDKPEGRVASEVLAELQNDALDAEHDAPSQEEEEEEEEEEEPEQTDGGEVLEPATREDLKKAMGRFVDKFTMDVAQKRLPEVMGYAKQSDIPENYNEFAKVIARIEEAIADD